MPSFCAMMGDGHEVIDIDIAGAQKIVARRDQHVAMMVKDAKLALVLDDFVILTVDLTDHLEVALELGLILKQLLQVDIGIAVVGHGLARMIFRSSPLVALRLRSK